MSDFETTLRWLSERGTPVGAEELIERIEAELAGDPLVVVAKRREGTTMTKTQQSPTTKPPSRNRGPAMAVAALVAVLAVAGLYFALSDDTSEVADNPPPTTVVPDVETMTDLEVIDAGVAAFYSGDAERAAELFELADRTDDQIRAESAYQAAIGGRLSQSCTEISAGEFRCTTGYQNAMTDAIGDSGGDDTHPVVVEDGVITQFGFTEHTGMLLEMGTFLAVEGFLDGYEDCVFGPFPESCATIQLEHLDAWVGWRQDIEPADQVTVALESWYGGNCQTAVFLDGTDFGDRGLCSTSSLPGQAIEYEVRMQAQVTIENCETTSVLSDSTVLSCEVGYSNIMNSAVAKPPSVTAREFEVDDFGLVREWYKGVYPEDTELRESFRLFAEGGELADEYAAAGCASARTGRTPDCALLIHDNLDDWAAWYQTNS